MGGEIEPDHGALDAPQTITVQQAELEAALRRALRASLPPPAPRQSLPVRAAKATPRWVAYLVSGLTLLGQFIALASSEEYRGPIVQAAKLVAVVVADVFDEDPSAPPEVAP